MSLIALEQQPLQRTPQSLIIAAIVLLACGGLALGVDLPVSRWATSMTFPGFVRKLVEISEIFGHGIGVLVIVAAAYHLDPRRRWALPRLMLIAYGGGMAANLTKFVIARLRPRGFDLASHDVWATFQAWSPPWVRSSVNESFPSAHTATAVAFAIALICAYPQARRFLLAAAAMVGVQRICSGAHFLSDVCCGAAVGSLTAAALLTLPGSVSWLEKLRSEADVSEARQRAPTGRAGGGDDHDRDRTATAA